MKTAMRISVSIAVLSLWGCAGQIHPYHYTFSLEDSPAHSLSVDAKLRMIFVKDHAGPDGKRRIVCAEPSPDAVVGLAASANLEAQVEGQGGKAGYSIAETLAKLSDRTQTIQILRDGLYRACEGYMNGSINEHEYKSIVSGYDDFVVTVVAIDGLTQHARSGEGAPKQAADKSAGVETMSGPGVAKPSMVPSQVSDTVAISVKEIVTEYLKHNKLTLLPPANTK